MSFDYILTTLVVVLLPGTGNLYTVAIGLGLGFRASVAAAVGCTLSILPSALASIVGLAALFHTSALAFQVVKYLGVAYLLYMAWTMLRSGGALSIEENHPPKSHARLATTGFLMCALNPKLSLFFLAFLPQFISLDASSATTSLILLATVFMGLTFIVFVGLGAGASLARDYVIARPNVLTWLKRGFAGAFGLLGLKLALTDR